MRLDRLQKQHNYKKDNSAHSHMFISTYEQNHTSSSEGVVVCGGAVMALCAMMGVN